MLFVVHHQSLPKLMVFDCFSFIKSNDVHGTHIVLLEPQTQFSAHPELKVDVI